MKVRYSFLIFTTIFFVFISTSFAQWEAIENEWDNKIRHIYTAGGYLFVSTSDEDGNNDQLFISTDNGDSFTNISDNLPDTSVSVYDITFHKGEIFLAAWTDIYASSDIGSTWRKIDHEVDFGGNPFSFLIISLESDGDVLYAGTYEFSSSSAYVLKSEDNGNSWEIVHLANAEVDQIEASNSYIYFKVGDYNIFRSELNGEEWKEIYSSTFGGTSSGIRGEFAVDTEGETIMVREAIDTLMISSDYGENFSASELISGNWILGVAYFHGTIFVRVNSLFGSEIDGGIMYRNSSTNNEWMSLSDDQYLELSSAMVANDQYLFIEYGDTLITRTHLSNFGITTDIDDYEETPSTFELSQNYPNPFNPSTTISYSIPEQSNVSLKVYDALGKEVAELINEEMSAGIYEVNFDASKLSSGIYFYTLNAGNVLQTRKMLLLK